MKKHLTELTDSREVIKSLRNYKKALKSICPPQNIEYSDLAFKYMAFVVDKLILLIKLLEKREKESLSKSDDDHSQIRSLFFKNLLEILSTSKNPDIRINIIRTIYFINLTKTLFGFPINNDKNINNIAFVESMNAFVCEIDSELKYPEKKWKIIKLYAAILALILFITAIIMFLAASNYTFTYMIIMATFAAIGILAPLIGLPMRSSKSSLLDYIFFNPTAKQIKLCIDDIRYPMFEGKKESKILLGMWGSVDDIHCIEGNNKVVNNVFLNKKHDLTSSIIKSVEEKYNEFNGVIVNTP